MGCVPIFGLRTLQSTLLVYTFDKGERMTQLILARKGIITPEVKKIAEEEKISPEVLAERVKRGEVVILKNRIRPLSPPVGVGKGLKTKVNTNLGTSPDFPHPSRELEKLKVALRAGTDTVMDLSIGGDLDEIRRKFLKEAKVPLGTVPVYQAAIEASLKEGGLVRLKKDYLFEIIEKQAEDGVDFITVHCGVTLSTLERLEKQKRLTDIVSRGGTFLACWMLSNEKENPLYEEFDRLLEIAQKYDVTLSLGDGLRPGSLHDSTDRAQIQELIFLGELADYAREKGVQVMIEGPGHLLLSEIQANVLLEKKLCRGAPFYVLGPVVTDIAPGYDHIVGAIGGALASSFGADFLCYVTPGEHLRLPTVEDVREGVISARVAAHIGDISKGIKGALDWDREISSLRKLRDWEKQIKLSLDPERTKKMREGSKTRFLDTCSMCGEYCVFRLRGKTFSTP